MRIGDLRAWVERVLYGLGAAVAAAILGFYFVRLFTPLPLFGADAGAYLIHALYPDEVAARDPYVAQLTNGAHLSLIRTAWRIGALTGWPYMLVDKLFDATLYLGGLLALWRVSTRRLRRRDQAVLLLLALGFAYGRFAFSNLAEGPFVGALALVCVITRAWWRKPLRHGLAAGLACAVLVLCKPHGLATVAALAAVAALDALSRRDGRGLAVRAAAFAVAFVGGGNLIQLAAEEPVKSPLAFFLSDVYSAALGQASPRGAAALGGQALAIMAGASLVLAGPPIVLGLCELTDRWRVERRGLRLAPGDIVFLLVLLSLAATLAMVAVFSMKVASTASETYRLWGRYFEFFAPMLWLSAAPALVRRPSRGQALLSGVAVLAGLSTLLALLQHGWIVLPWDSAVLTAFFAPDPMQAAITLTLPLRGLATAACLLAVVALALRVRPAVAGCALLLALGGLSTWLDHAWLGEMARHRTALARDLRAIAPALPKDPARVVLITPDANVGHLGFLELGAQPFVVLGDPARPPAGALDGAEAVVASGAAAPAGAWTASYRGAEVSLWRPAPVSVAALPSGP